ncbi:elongation factor P--(R)-beta-lysine ligase [Pelagibaculum spongiae]|uniref:Elongation factor P lysine(34) lysyltransferase n=1 Tax=Pelagibaculum spongiae TaxID=2080658 RepID=A0A2V1GXB4_9GAMM|nr:elongation factor P--(R)-beta-lysine ligase [Pelagibaculum spongiae]PVZ65673.1 elongation factor P lysine(34) lysyltransferase [Pelagibaculum spongiae]
MDWQPGISVNYLKARAKLLGQIRGFFAQREVMEVETPLLMGAPVTDPWLQALSVKNHRLAAAPDVMWLQTSPEYAMKRLLAAGSGAIYQICKAFRDDESGRKHNHEFTMLEWYRPDFSLVQLMDETDQLLQLTLNCQSAERVSYQQLFIDQLSIDPLTATTQQLQRAALVTGMQGPDDLDVDGWLQLLMGCVIEPKLGHDRPLIVYGFPPSQSALAKVENGVASRFEVYCKGVELANAYHELTDAIEQRSRAEQDLVKRSELGLPMVPIDEKLLAAVEAGLPDCSGIALGVDRLLMLVTDEADLRKLISFDASRI